MTTRQFNESVNAEIRRMTAQQHSPECLHKGDASACPKCKPINDAHRFKTGIGYFGPAFDAELTNKAQQGEPTSFSQWLERNGDSIEDIGGNVVPDRVQANNDIYKNGNPFQT